jgi:hypothetical protein
MASATSSMNIKFQRPGKLHIENPRMVVHQEVAIDYADWTGVNHLRHSKFIAVRHDKQAFDVKRVQPVG